MCSSSKELSENNLVAPLKKVISPQRHREKDLSFSVKTFNTAGQKVNFLKVKFKISVFSVVKFLVFSVDSARTFARFFSMKSVKLFTAKS